jgi:hypothetical protein
MTHVPADTTPEAAWVQMQIYRRMPFERRLELTLGMSESLREICAAGVRSRHPEYTDEEVRHEVIRLTLGPELFRKAYPHVKLPS